MCLQPIKKESKLNSKGGSEEGSSNLSAAGLEEAVCVCVCVCVCVRACMRTHVCIFFNIVTSEKILYRESIEMLLEVFLLI